MKSRKNRLNLSYKVFTTIATTALTLSVAISCSQKKPSDRLGLERLDSLCDSIPKEVISRLDSIKDIPMTETERHRYDLLLIKAKDKAYIPHTSDSLVLDVIKYYSGIENNIHLPEALYYGGRVYYDLGDYTRAIEFFQDALDALPETQANSKFRGNILSQTGALLDDLRMFSDSETYLKKSIAISRQLGDEEGLAYDYLRICGVLIHLSKFDEAQNYVDDAIKLSHKLTSSDIALVKTHKAAILYYRGKIDSALAAVRDLPKAVDPEFRDYTLSYAAKIYLAAGSTDTAYRYALQLSEGSNPVNKNLGLSLMFDDRLKNLIPKDSLESFSIQYAKSAEHQLNTHQPQESIESVSRYKYKQHKLRGDNAEKKKNKFIVLLYVASSLFAIVLIAIVHHTIKRKKRHDSDIKEMESNNAMLETELNREKEKTYSYAETIESIKSQNKSLQEEVTNVREEISNTRDELNRVNAENEDLQNTLIDTRLKPNLSQETALALKQKLLSSIMNADTTGKNVSMSDSLVKSAVYMELRDYIENDKIISDNKFWTKLGDEIEKSYPNFTYKLQILTNWQMSDSDYQTALLIRCKVPSGRAASLLGIMKNSVSTRRSSLAAKIFGSQSELKSLDALILSL